MPSKPTIILVHGFWGDAAHWGKVIVLLSKAGYESIWAVENPLTALADDAERTRKMIAQQKGPVLLVGHSYGGAVITQAGDQPNVVGLVYIAAFAPDVGENLVDLNQQFPAPAGSVNILAPDSDGYVFINPQKFHESFCQDLMADEALIMAATQKAPIGSIFVEKLTKAAWKSKPSWYQISSEDRMINSDLERKMAARIAPKKTITLKSSHASMASKPIEVCALIDEAARTAVSEATPAMT